jgi:small subunit ribosomal protein S2
MVEVKEKTEKEEAKKVESENFGLDIEEMAKAGLHFGHRVSKIHPQMMPYLAGARNTVHLIDLEKTKEKFESALKFIQQLISENKILLLVGTKIQVKELVKEVAVASGLPYVIERWLGGTFTNFGVMKKRVEYMKELEQKLANSEIMQKYKKKEKAKMEQELRELKLKFEGIKNLEKLPDAIFVFDMKKDNLAVKEARMKGVKVVAISDTNTDPSLADYPIPANDDAISSLKYILDKVKEVILKAKSEIRDQKPETNPNVPNSKSQI